LKRYTVPEVPEQGPVAFSPLWKAREIDSTSKLNDDGGWKAREIDSTSKLNDDGGNNAAWVRTMGW
jgi:hypothetical protein